MNASPLPRPDPTLNLLRLELKYNRVARYIRRRCGLPLDDLRYTVHVALEALDIAHFVRPFQIQEPKCKGTVVPLIAYGPNQRRIREYLTLDANVDAEKLAMIDLTTLTSKPMPFQWARGEEYRYQVDVVPTIRPEGRDDVDAFLVEKATDPAMTREAAYHKLLSARLEGAAEVLDLRVTRFQVSRKFFRAQAPEGEERRINRPTMPDATFQGTLRIREPARFEAACFRGIDRYDWLGFGMLKLLPVAD